jgi:fluoride exporter
MVWLLIFVGGGLGSLCRYALGAMVQSRSHATFPVGTLVVNVLGCVIIGIVARHVLNMQGDILARAAIITGFCGGFTTFSTFSYETVGLIAGGEWGKAGLYVLASLIACVGGTALGMSRVFAR